MENNSAVILKRSSDFENIKKNGRRHWPVRWLLLNYINNNLEVLRFGVTASRKTGNAVVRNKLKRWCRAYFKNNTLQSSVIGFDINLIFKPMDKDFYSDLTYVEFKNALDIGIYFVGKNR